MEEIEHNLQSCETKTGELLSSCSETWQPDLDPETTTDPLAEDTDLQLELKERGLERAKKFSWDETARRVYEVLSMYRREKS